MKVICIIPARGGSKRIPMKNIKLFNGKPIINFAINAAINSKCFDEIIVSTDSNEIAAIAKKEGAKIPFIRPKNLADDFTNTTDVICHSIEYFERNNIKFYYICCLYPTTPFIEAKDFRKGITLLNKVEKDRFVFAATSFPFPIQRAISINRDGLSDPIDKESVLMRSQDLKPMFHDAGLFYMGRKLAWFSKKQIFMGSRPLILPRWKVHDIDTLEDWERAELIYNACISKSSTN